MQCRRWDRVDVVEETASSPAVNNLLSPGWFLRSRALRRLLISDR